MTNCLITAIPVSQQSAKWQPSWTITDNTILWWSVNCPPSQHTTTQRCNDCIVVRIALNSRLKPWLRSRLALRERRAASVPRATATLLTLSLFLSFYSLSFSSLSLVQDGGERAMTGNPRPCPVVLAANAAGATRHGNAVLLWPHLTMSPRSTTPGRRCR